MIEAPAETPQTYSDSLVAHAMAAAALATMVGATVLYCLSARETLEDAGFVGARAARDEVLVVLAAGAAMVGLALAARRYAAVFVCAVAMTIGLTLSVTSGQLREVIAAAMILTWAWVVGAALLRLLVLDDALDLAARVALALGLGVGALSFGVLTLALVGVLNDVALGVLLAGGFIPAALTILSEMPPVLSRGWGGLPRVAIGGISPRLDAIERACLAMIVVLAVVGFAVSLTPQVNFDALHYHFAAPLTFWDEGRLVERPDIIQSYFPFGLEMVYVIAFRLGGEATANLLHWCFLPMTAAVLWSAGDRFFGRPAGALGAAIFALTPMVVWESTTASSDLALTFFVVAGVYLVVLFMQRRRELLAFVAGLCLGLALAFKLVATLYIAPVAGVFFVALFVFMRARPGVLRQAQDDQREVHERTARRPTFGQSGFLSAALFGLGGLIGGAPWLVVRFGQTGNPVFPLYNNVFQSDKWPPRNERFDLGQFGIGTSATDALSFWWDATAHPMRFGQAMPSWVLGIVLLLFVAVVPVLPRLRRTPGGLVWLTAALAGLGAWFFLSQYHRYGLPAFALLAPVAGFGVMEAARVSLVWGRARSMALVGLASAWFAAGTIVSVATFSLVVDHFPTDVLLGRESEEVHRQRSVPDYNAIRFFDEATRGTGDSGAIIGFPYNYFAANRLYDVIVPAELSPFRRAAEAGLAPDALARALLSADVRWFIYDSRNPFGEAVFPPAWLASSVLAPEFIERHLEVAFDESGVIVYRIVEVKAP